MTTRSKAKQDKGGDKKTSSPKKQEKERQEPPKSATKKAAAPEPKEAKAQASKKRPEPEPAAPPPYQPETSELEKKRLHVAEELRKVETQIYDLETKYLDQSSAFGNAVRGYEGFLGGLSQANRKVIIKPEERLFSMSSSSSIPPH